MMMMMKEGRKKHTLHTKNHTQFTINILHCKHRTNEQRAKKLQQTKQQKKKKKNCNNKTKQVKWQIYELQIDFRLYITTSTLQIRI